MHSSGKRPQQGSNHGFEEKISEKYTVRCPNCQALFTLDVTGLDKYDVLRFRCSQCRNEFKAEEAEWQPYREEKAQEETDISAPTDSFDFSFDEEDVDFQTSSLKGNQWQTGFEEVNKSNDFDIMANIEKNIDLSTPKEIVQTKQKTANAQIPLDFDSPNKQTRSEEAIENFTYREPLQNTANAITADIPSREPSRWSATALLATPFFCLLIALAVASVYLTKTPFEEGGLLRSILPSSQKVPPPGLMLSNISFRRVALPSGEIVHLISGVLQNHTERSFKEVILEGLGFDAGGQKVSALKVNAGATLAKARVESFSPEMISELQGRESIRHFDLEPGDEQAFTLGLLSDEMNAAKYYSARIYSAR